MWRPLAETFGRDVHQRLGAIRGRLVHFPLNYLRYVSTSMLFGENSTESILGFILNITSQVLSFLFFSFFRDEDLQPAKLAKEAMVPAELWKWKYQKVVLKKSFENIFVSLWWRWRHVFSSKSDRYYCNWSVLKTHISISMHLLKTIALMYRSAFSKVSSSSFTSYLFPPSLVMFTIFLPSCSKCSNLIFEVFTQIDNAVELCPK